MWNIKGIDDEIDGRNTGLNLRQTVRQTDRDVVKKKKKIQWKRDRNSYQKGERNC